MSLENFSLITVEFDENIKKESAKLKVKDKIDAVTSVLMATFNNVKVELPALNLSFGRNPTNIGLSGDLPIEQMKFYGELLQDKIEQMSEIKEVALRGVQDFEIEVALDLLKMNAATVSFDDVINAIRRGNSTISAGNVEGNGLRRNLRVIGEIDSPEALEKFVLKNQNGTVYMGDVATISFKEKEKNSFARSDGKKALVLDIKKAGKTSQNGRTRIVADDRPTISSTIESIPTTNPATKNLVSDLANNIVFGVLLVATVRCSSSV